MTASRVRLLFFVLLTFSPLAALAVYHGAIHHWLCDDAFISFRYVRNLVDGHGLVFNPGERVEGYTNFLWVLELAAIWKILHIPPETSATILSWTFTVGAYLLTAVLAARTAFPKRFRVAMWGAIAFLAVSRTFAVWATSGLETRQFTLLVLLAGHHLTANDPRDRRYVLASLALAGCELTRPEGNLMWGCCLVWYLGDSLGRGEFRWRRCLSLVTPYAVVVGAHMVFRLLYYGDIFPNTYYAKHVQSWPEAGFHYFTLIFCQTGLHYFLILSAIGAMSRLAARRDTSGLLFLGLILPHMYYVFRIGGDHFEFRPLDFYWPLLAVLTMDGIFALGRLAVHVVRVADGWRSWMVEATAAGACFLLLLYAGNILQFAHYCLSYELTTREETFRLALPVTVQNFPAAYFLPGMGRVIEMHNAAAQYCSQHSIACPQIEHKVYWKLQVSQWGSYAKYAGRMGIPDTAVTNFVTIGISSYYLPEITVVDCLGLTDYHVAHQRVFTLNKFRNMAHDRHATADYIESRGMNILPCPPAANLAEALATARYALRLAEDVWMPFNSARPDWVRKGFVGKPLYTRNRIRNVGLAEECTLDGWQLRGQAMENQPSRGPHGNQQLITGAGPHCLINTYHPGSGDASMGTALSPPFTVEGRSFLCFRVAGGSGPQVGVELLVGDASVQSWRGRDNEELEPVTVELTPYIGKTMRVRVFDDTTAGWGHIVATSFEILSATAQRVDGGD